MLSLRVDRTYAKLSSVYNLRESAAGSLAEGADDGLAALGSGETLDDERDGSPDRRAHAAVGNVADAELDAEIGADELVEGARAAELRRDVELAGDQVALARVLRRRHKVGQVLAPRCHGLQLVARRSAGADERVDNGGRGERGDVDGALLGVERGGLVELSESERMTRTWTHAAEDTVSHGHAERDLGIRADRAAEVERIEASDFLADGRAEGHVGHAQVDALADGVEVRRHELPRQQRQ